MIVSYNFLSYLLGNLSFYTVLENNIIFIQEYFRLRGIFPPPCGRPWIRTRKNVVFHIRKLPAKLCLYVLHEICLMENFLKDSQIQDPRTLFRLPEACHWFSRDSVKKQSVHNFLKKRLFFFHEKIETRARLRSNLCLIDGNSHHRVGWPSNG